MDNPIATFLGDGPGSYQQPPVAQQPQQQQSPYQGGVSNSNGQSPYGNIQIQPGGIAPHFVQHGQPQSQPHQHLQLHQQQQPQQMHQAHQQYQPPLAQYQPPAAQYMPPAHGVGGPPRPPLGGAPDNGGSFTPLSELTPYSRRWKVKARVTEKSDIRKFRNGEGQLFSIEISDGTGSLRGALFGQAVDKFFNLLREKGVYTFTGGQVKRANKAFNPNADFEITFSEQSEIVEVPDDGAIPAQLVQYNFKSLVSLENEANGSIVDVAVVVAELKETIEVNLKVGGTKPKRDVILVDDSGASVGMTLWGNSILQTDGMRGRVVFIKGAKVSDFGGRSLSNLSQTRLDFEAAGPRGDELRAWYQAHGREPVKNALTGRGGGNGPRQTLEECKEEDNTLGIEDSNNAPDPNVKYVHFHTLVPVTLQYMAHDRAPFYLACPQEVAASEEGKPPRCCNKKVENMNGQYMCALGHSCQQPTARWLFNPVFGDETGSASIRVFDEAGVSLMGCPANVISRIWEQKESNTAAADEVDNIFRAAQWKRWRLRVKSKRTMWNDEERIEMMVMEATPVQIVKEGNSMLGDVCASLNPPLVLGNAAVSNA